MRKKRLKKKAILILLIILLITSSLIISATSANKSKVKQKNTDNKELVAEIKNSFNEFVKVKGKAKVYDKKEKEIGEVSNIELKLKEEDIDENTKYFYAENIEAYISYKDVEKIDKIEEYQTNRIPFNQEIKTKKDSKININEDTYYKLNKEVTFEPIKIDGGKYFFLYDNHLAYINEEDIEEKADIDKYKYTDAISVINYHYVINLEAGEKKDCQQSICMTDTKYDEEMKYLKDNGYYTATMEDLDLWIDKKINLPEKTVVITIDDGWFVERNIQILEKYDLHATLFLIGHLAPPDDYRSNNLEIHSHTWDMHNLGECPIKRGGAILCKDKNYILEDLKKSSESLNNSKYFAYPFYEYNDHAIEALKEAGFRMAFAGGSRKVKQGMDKYTLPRYGMVDSDTMSSFIQDIS